MEQTYSFKEFNQMLEAKSDTGAYIVKKLSANPRIKKMAIFVGAVTIDFKAFGKKAFAETSTEEAFKQIDKAGFMFLSLAQKIGFWVCIVLCTIEILKCLFSGDNRDMVKIIMKYLIALFSLYALPFAFNLIVAMFS